MQRLTVFAIIFRASSDRCSNYQHALVRDLPDANVATALVLRLVEALGSGLNTVTPEEAANHPLNSIPCKITPRELSQ
jgi:hypothetical protein